MRKSHLLASATTVAAMSLAMVAGPGGAGPSTINLVVSSGALTISAPTTISGSGNLGTTPQLTVDGITVDDRRGTLSGWTASLTSSPLTTAGGGTPDKTIPASAMTWTTTTITPLEGQVAIAVPMGGTLDGSVTAAVGAPLLSAGGFEIDGHIAVAIPNGNATGAYSGTLTTSIS